jgi:hypothetical protein
MFIKLVKSLFNSKLPVDSNLKPVFDDGIHETFNNHVRFVIEAFIVEKINERYEQVDVKKELAEIRLQLSAEFNKKFYDLAQILNSKEK